MLLCAHSGENTLSLWVRFDQAVNWNAIPSILIMTLNGQVLMAKQQYVSRKRSHSSVILLGHNKLCATIRNHLIAHKLVFYNLLA